MHFGKSPQRMGKSAACIDQPKYSLPGTLSQPVTHPTQFSVLNSPYTNVTHLLRFEGSPHILLLLPITSILNL